MKDGRFIPTNPAAFRAAFEYFVDGSNVEVTVGKPVKKRSNPQNAYLWGAVYDHISRKTGAEPDEIHAAMKAMFNYETKIVSVVQMSKKTGKLRTVRKHIKVPLSTANLSTEEFSIYVEKVRAWASSFLCLYIPDPGEAGYR
jgi:hypothetical protein